MKRKNGSSSLFSHPQLLQKSLFTLLRHESHAFCHKQITHVQICFLEDPRFFSLVPTVAITSVESLNGETLPLRNSSKSRSQMALPSKSKRGYGEASVIKGWVGETFLSFLHLVLVPSARSSSASRHPVASNLAPLSLDPEVDLMNFD
jgi:hypothetical protein